MWHRTVAWTSDVTYICAKGAEGVNVTFDNTKNKAMECFSTTWRRRRSGQCQISLPAQAGFISWRRAIASKASSTRERPRALTRTPLLCTQIVLRPSSRRGVQVPADFQHGWNGPAVEGDAWMHVHHKGGEVCPRLQSIQGPFHPPAGG